MATVLVRDKETKYVSDSEGSVDAIPPLGVPGEERRFWFQRVKAYDPDAIATQPSVFDDSTTAEKYQPPSHWENIGRFDPLARWTWREEAAVVRKIDIKIMFFACVMFMALELDRANISQALTDNFLDDLKMNTNDYNLGNTVFKLAFLCAELPSQLVSKWMGPDRWIPTQMCLWSVVAFSQFWLSGRDSFLACRALLGLLQGGFIPDVILYLSYFYKHHELSIRLSFFWAMMSLADIISALLAAGLLKMRGLNGHAGWRYLFLIDGLITLVFGLLAYGLMPPGPTQTANWFRGKKGWFTEREETIIVNRVIREDPTKSSMHNREPITPKLLWQSLKDYDLWPLYILGLLHAIPATPVQQYLTLSLKGLGFDTFQSNLLTIPYTVLHMINLLIITYVAEIFQNLSFVAVFSQIWILPFMIYYNVVDTTTVSRWVIFAISSLILAYPYPHAIQVAWNSRNSNSVRSRTVSAACYNMFVQAGAIVASNIYRADDAPQYRRGKKQLLAIVCMNIVVYGLVKVYYLWRNKGRDQKWNSMSESERVEYLNTTKDAGNKRLDFRFSH
ncbi:major facilitator superfamily domain-containing protein [Dactylonectria estremocensis]|uniref:Major facilitator superfamily domain-containing protein n=1 Tax=Dactylonectria estremocensis TaxID=1079267 RepID=A0A9P9EIX0_9HYPO|nr:major facilitator superfamily domain-containing protein [Dactylonectria estremocensis]